MFPVSVRLSLTICHCLLEAGLVSLISVDSYEINMKQKQKLLLKLSFRPLFKWFLHMNRLIHLTVNHHINSPGPNEQNELSHLVVTPLFVLLQRSKQHLSVTFGCVPCILPHRKSGYTEFRKTVACYSLVIMLEWTFHILGIEPWPLCIQQS